ncbi:pullulanase-type alpha-1,6-glucosidase [Microbacterium sp. EYE_5]|uniref:pullulanase-type alpha-1,6-glucosidase n=1 Tax=unclassified Microbacterium TaxID=2609290 RepID=UPI002004C817|nr:MULTISPECIES: pullulanase-type alpha-1,6-glucosidase [unclassified Microbacterium]MCK6079191.1 pullulanase-type alpha-1,6-glucosidase [Microbacterium sp. EYE_382]MCK6084461.1 pullulanase-type alpha-1,6-glucosidase [Microbacterium sp. EYE_384]MCK6123310.1 pullulanase-type alpha-1,6-glucosidase [Microbacterium sp. EYE_80]MCK6125225.1 pullulanase-type alpha-1,6-glucosidase [Microbacterium sp. EYE_79]MCK6140145.1 pullulanase-type alpha-1,6-glucosidase [Microbacterium sp. EYE_39]
MPKSPSSRSLPPYRRVLAAATSGILLSSALALTAPVAAAADPRSFALVGDLQSELGCSGDWQPDCTATELAPTSTPDVYAAEFEIPAGSFEYKVAVDDSWDEAYGLDGGGDNIPLTVAGPTTVRVIFDDVQHRVGLEVLSLRGDYAAEDDALVADPVRQPGDGKQFYFVMTDRFANGDASNDTGGLTGDRLATGFDPTSTGFYQGGDIAGLRENLDYIKGLGTTAIWLTPSFMNKPVQGEGANASAGYHGYWSTDFTRIDPHLGTNEELKSFIDEAHAEGIDVYFDIITNHTADVIAYEEGEYSYIDQKTRPYTDAAGTPFDPADYAGTAEFPELDAATSFPYTPVVTEAEKDVKVPAWLNDPTLYHNRGDSTYSGESTTHGDFSGLDDLMTEHPDVVSGFVEVYEDWIDLGIDGFRIDTAKHVNFEFWEQWTTEVREYAASVGKDDFFMFGEVYDADPAVLAPYVRDSDMNSVLDFGFQSAATSFAKGGKVDVLAKMFAGDDRYTTPDSSATALPTFLGNHDMGRIGYFLKGTADALERDRLAHDLMFLSRGQPVVYYGDEQGFAGADPGGDKAARQSLFGTQVPEYRDQQLITGETVGSADRYDTSAPVYAHVAELSQLRAEHPALVDGAQIERYAADGVYAFSRVDRTERIEHLVALNNTASAQTVEIPTLTADASFSSLYGAEGSVSSDAAGTASVEVPALSAVVLRADGEVTAPAAAAPLTVSAPAPGAGLQGSTRISAATDASWRETSFAWRVAGGDEWTPLGTAEDTTPGVFADVRGLGEGTLVEYRAVSTDAAGQRSAASTYASVGNRVNLAVETEPEQPEEPTVYDAVSIPGSLNTELGCGSDWAPDCDQAQMTLVDGKWRLSVDLAAGTYEYKVATEKSWDENYGADGVPGGANIVVTHPGGPITFFFDPLTKRVQSSSEGPVVTLAGSFQSELGCAADWSPDCLRAMMFDGDRDGVYEFSTKGIPTGSYEVKVAHGLSWDENYGADGVRGGENIAFTATAGKAVVFRYDSETHVLEIDVADPPLAGTGESRAHWIDAETLAWPGDLGGADAGASWSLYGSADAQLAVTDGTVAGGEAIELSPVDGGLTDEQRARFPALAEFTALRLDDVDRDAVAELLRGQLRVAERDAAGALTAVTGVQIPGVLDDLYADAVADDALGVSFSGKGAKAKTTFRLWAPTAQSATLLTWDAGGTGDPVRHDASFDAASGTWTATGGRALIGDEYLWEVVVFAPSTDEIETNTVTDPASVALTENSTRSVAIDLADRSFMPKQWQKAKPKPVQRNVDRAIYELHIRDFSISDETVPAAERGTYAAFSRKSAGTAQLRQLAEAGINTVHLLPSFDIATIEEERAAQETPDCDLASFGPASPEQQACIAEVADTDGFNWGYDPFHFTTPEGSYALRPDGGARVAEFRGMVGALHGMGLQVVLDQVFNHTAESGQGAKSVLDRVVPGYYHRLNLAGAVETSTCCQNIATEHEVAEKLMVDSVVTWARDYKVDGFRFDLMGHHSKANMLAVREALDALTVKKDGVDGAAVHLYGEGWNFGEVADDALFEQATQGQLGGTGIATFNDRLRDAVHGGSPVDSGSTFRQGFGTGLGTDPNGDPINGSTDEALADLARQTDLVKLGLVGNLREFELPTADGSVKAGSELDYNGQSAGYADEPDEVINYVDAHDNETLYDLSVLKLPVETSMDDRVRMNTLSLATVTLSQSPSFWHAGTELLRSKSLDRNSYNSGDWFNRIDWTGEESTFGSGLPPAADNEEKWPVMAPLLENTALKPGAADMAAAEAAALDLLRVRSEVGLLRLGSAEAIAEKVSFPNSGPDADPGVIVMRIDDTAGAADADRRLDGALVVFNASPEATTQTIDDLAGRGFALSAAQARGSDAVVKTTTWDAATGTVTVPARSVAVLVDAAPVATAVVAVPTPPVAKQGAAVRMTGKVIAVDGSTPVGTVTVMEGSKTLASGAIEASAKGRIDLPLPKLGKGVHVLRTSFTGAGEHADSRSLVPIPLLVY